ncbi:serine hydrolase [Chitinophaga sp. sic0106]|uniref:serine hydrolase domain-containing protein n=1 Tax=Chitinophaga sp. sic0106 TaxID=2854785 RepID=UPI001C4462A4|nr:serine hydrolase domain-containing protein [Chitinophaga sp. sic0106]MBV7531394.1 beta-lactamase family protein [Chitinophaga sp. sic0106]
MKTSILLLTIATFLPAFAQRHAHLADSIRTAANIPELSYAVISDNDIMELYYAGTRKAGSNMPARANDRFRIGSNTKAITAFMMAHLLQAKGISWQTELHELLPELKGQMNPAYTNISLGNLLSLRIPLPAYTYTTTNPDSSHFTGNATEQRRQFATWLLQQPPSTAEGPLFYTNAGYIVAGLCMERISGKTYEENLADLNRLLHTRFSTGSPNNADNTQTWGHNANGQPEPPSDNYKFNWLMAAGNINTTLTDYTKFLQLQLKAFKGNSNILTIITANYLLFGYDSFAMGWFWERNANQHKEAHNIGNPGDFLTAVHIIPAVNRGYIVFANCQTDAAAEAVNYLVSVLKKDYGE